MAALRAAAVHPVHAYLFRGAAGNGGLVAAHGFAAAAPVSRRRVRPCRTCQRALSGSDPDLHVIHRSGATLSVDDMRRLVLLAQRRPLQADRQVVIVTDVHLGGPAAPALLKTLEEPPGATVFVLLADDIPPSWPRSPAGVCRSPSRRCPGPPWWTWLARAGRDGRCRRGGGRLSGGNPERARVMIEDPDVAERAALWSSVPDQLNDTGVVAAELARGLLASAERAVEPLRAEHARELERLTEEAAEFGEKGLPGRKEITDHYPARGAAVAHGRPAGRAGCAGPGLPGPDDGQARRTDAEGRPSMRRRRPTRCADHRGGAGVAPESPGAPPPAVPARPARRPARPEGRTGRPGRTRRSRLR